MAEWKKGRRMKAKRKTVDLYWTIGFDVNSALSEGVILLIPRLFVRCVSYTVDRSVRLLKYCLNSLSRLVQLYICCLTRQNRIAEVLVWDTSPPSRPPHPIPPLSPPLTPPCMYKKSQWKERKRICDFGLLLYVEILDMRFLGLRMAPWVGKSAPKAGSR